MTMKMKRLKYLFPAALTALLAAGCSDQAVEQPDVPAVEETATEITVTATMTVDKLPVVDSRAFGDTPGAGLTVNVFEFTGASDFSSRFLVRKYPATVTSATTAANNGVDVNFKFTLMKTAEARVLHFVVAPEDLTVEYGSVAPILQSLSVSGNTDAYWGRVEFPDGYCERKIVDNKEVYIQRDDALANLKSIPVIRNFAKVSVSLGATANNFELTGFELVNVPSAGTVAPWNITAQAIPDLLNNKAMRPYSEVTGGTINYHGILSPQATITHTEKDLINGTLTLGFNSTQPQYMYEHPYEEGRRTYVIVAGRYNGAADVTYYKIDLGREEPLDPTQPNGAKIFKNYDVLRNYHYAVTINTVARAGYPTVKEAIEGTVFNNLSASTETRDMTSLSDGIDLIGVNTTKFVVTQAGEALVFKCKYTKDINNGKGTTDNSLLTFYGLKDGPIISGKPVESVDGDSVVYTISTKAPSDLPLEQTFTVVGRNGLGRTITLLSHTPWKLSNIQTFKGSENTRPTITQVADTIIGTEMGDALTIYFDLPDGMSSAWFPLQFVLESNRQNIENNSAVNSTLVVSPGQSLWTDITDQRVRYIKTVTYEQYMYQSDANNVVDHNTLNTTHTVRCRFRTTLALSSLPGSPTQTVTNVRISNPYFEMGKEWFVRK